jgi:hypothetical protein
MTFPPGIVTLGVGEGDDDEDPGLLLKSLRASLPGPIIVPTLGLVRDMGSVTIDSVECVDRLENERRRDGIRLRAGGLCGKV